MDITETVVRKLQTVSPVGSSGPVNTTQNDDVLVRQPGHFAMNGLP
jgi:hypothetical protein